MRIQSYCASFVVCHLELLQIEIKQKSAKYNITVCRPNSLGYGYRITDINASIIINCESMGNYCVANSGVVGVKTRGDNAPIIGNSVELATGCKVIGSVVIGDNAIVAPKLVVVKDVEAGTVVSGGLAKYLKIVRKA